ncbi:MAG: leucine-rich repeat protein [Prevotellaceae bacterium]|nr:leucine-rich repeat protein [Prevotellaceae bacterium]
MKKIFLFSVFCIAVSLNGFATKATTTYSSGSFSPTINSFNQTTLDTLVVVSATATDYISLENLRSIRTKFVTAGDSRNGKFTLDLSAVAFENNILPGGSAVEAGAFFQMNCLKEVILPNGLKQIGNYTFRYCAYLAKINLPDGLEVIGDRAFAMGTTGLLVLTSMPNTIKKIDQYAFYAQTSLGLTSLPNSITEIYPNTFYGAKVAISKIPEGVTVIEKGTFNCGNVAARQLITSMDFPSTLTTLFTEAFRYQVNLKTLRFRTATPPFSGATDPFLDGATKSEITVWVPKGARGNYSSLTALAGTSIKEAGTVTYYANSGSGDAPVEGEKIVGETFAAAANTFTAPSGKVFVRWNTQSNGNGSNYAAGATITPVAGSGGDTESITLYAVWDDATGVNAAKEASVKVWTLGDRLHIQADKNSNDVKLFDLTGRLLETLPANTSSHDISRLSRGVYILQVDDASVKFTKQ